MTRDFEALHAYLDGRVRAPFAWGGNDCVTFAAGAAKAQTGRDFLKPLGLRWRSAGGAAKALAALGGLEAAVDGVLTRVPPAMARRGDVGLVDIEGRQSLVVIEGDLVCGPGADGLVRLPRLTLATAWTLER